MKKVIAFAAFGVAVLSLTSCKKDYTCTCTGTGLPDEVINIPKAKKADAESVCNDAKTQWSVAGYTECTLTKN